MARSKKARKRAAAVERWRTRTWADALTLGLEVRFGRHEIADLLRDGEVVGVRWFGQENGNRSERRER